MSHKTPRPLFAMSKYDPGINRGDKYFLDLDGVTKAEEGQIEIVLQALNVLDLSEPQARKALLAVVGRMEGWRLPRAEVEWVKEGEMD